MKIRENIAQFQEYRRNGITTLAAAQTYEKDKAIKYNQKPQTIPLTYPGMPLAGSSSYVPLNNSLKRSNSSVYSPVAGFAESPKTIGRKPANPLDISTAEAIHLLTEREQHLCSTLRILPKSYLAIKETLIREYTKAGGLKRRQARGLIKIDVNKTSKIYDFFVEMGWVKKSM